MLLSDSIGAMVLLYAMVALFATIEVKESEE